MLRLCVCMSDRLLKAPMRGMLWASGKPWQPHKEEPEKVDKDKEKNQHKAAKDRTPPV